jgi:hypothetical protein
MALKQSSKVHNGRLPTPHNQKVLSVKTMLLTFFILEGLFIMSLYQLDKQSTKLIIWKYWKGWVKKTEMTQNFANNSWILHHNNASAHTALSVREFLASKQLTVLKHPPFHQI